MLKNKEIGSFADKFVQNTIGFAAKEFEQWQYFINRAWIPWIPDFLSYFFDDEFFFGLAFPCETLFQQNAYQFNILELLCFMRVEQ